MMIETEIMEEILEVIIKHDNFIISSHINPDGDAIGSQLAFYSLLSDLGKSVSVVNSTPLPADYAFLPNSSVFHLFTGSDEHQVLTSELSFQDIEVAIILDCGNLNRIGDNLVKRVHPKVALVNIDHHESNDKFGTYNMVDADACATAELIFNLMEHGKMPIGKDRAICLYTAILTDTGSFRFSNTKANTYRIAARLVEEGAQPDQIAGLVYEVIPYKKAKLFGMFLNTLQTSPDGKIAWAYITKDMFEQTNTSSEDMDDFIDYIRSIKGVDLAMLLRELDEGGFKVSLRSKTNLRVDKICAMFNGGGHQAAAGCTIRKPLEKAVDMMLNAIKSEMS
jgi:phosphoesterase RecJ-like protein